MKTERKHELEVNELSDWMATFANDIKPYIKLITAAVVLLSVAIFLFSFGAAQRKRNLGLAWTDLFALQVDANTSIDPDARSDYVDRLVELADREEGSPVSAWAMQYAGDISLALGSDKLWENRAEATDRFREAVENYDKALARADHDILKQRALMGLAQANEAIDDFAAAEASYQSIIDRWPDSAVAKSAADRLAFLQQNSTREFYDWFLKQDPPEPQLPATGPATPQSSDPFSIGPPQSSDATAAPDGAASGFEDFKAGIDKALETNQSPESGGAIGTDDATTASAEQSESTDSAAPPAANDGIE